MTSVRVRVAESPICPRCHYRRDATGDGAVVRIDARGQRAVCVDCTAACDAQGLAEQAARLTRRPERPGRWATCEVCGWSIAVLDTVAGRELAKRRSREHQLSHALEARGGVVLSPGQ